MRTTLASPGNDRYVLALAVLFGFEWTALAISPRYRQDWLLENALTVVFVAALIVFRHRLPLSRISYTALFIFLSLHSIGAHYTYSEVPYDEWTRTGTHAEQGPYSVEEWLLDYASHPWDHAEQARRVLAALRAS